MRGLIGFTSKFIMLNFIFQNNATAPAAAGKAATVAASAAVSIH